MSLIQITRDQYIKAKLLDSPLFFTRYFFKHQYNRKFVVSEHHKEICRVIKRILKGECRRIIINMPPRYGKTELLVKTLMSIGLAINPKSKFIHTSYSETLALDNSETVKDLIESEEYQKYFNFRLKKDSKSKRKWYTDEGGGIYAAASGGQITGFGAGQVDEEDKELKDYITDIDLMKDTFNGAIIIDDPIKPEDAEYPQQRTKINERFDNTIRSRVNSRNTPIIIVMQRVHEEDLTGYLLDTEPEEWEVLNMPAISEDNKPLWEFKHTLEELLKLKKANETVFQNQYQQDPKPAKGMVFNKEDLSFFNLNELNTHNIECSIGAIDVADEGLDNFSFPIGNLINDKFYVSDWVFTQENTEYTIPLTTQKTKQHKINHLAIETNNHGSVFLKQVSQNIKGTAIYGIHQSTKKHSRVIQQSHIIRNYFVFRNDYEIGSDYDRAMKQLFSYTKDGKETKDDAPDSLALLSTVIQDLFPTLWF